MGSCIAAGAFVVTTIVPNVYLLILTYGIISKSRSAKDVVDAHLHKINRTILSHCFETTITTTTTQPA